MGSQQPETERQASEADSRQNGWAANGLKVKATIHLSLEASQRLTVHAAMMGLDRSELVEQLINDHLRRFVVSDRGGGGSRGFRLLGNKRFAATKSQERGLNDSSASRISRL